MKRTAVATAIVIGLAAASESAAQPDRTPQTAGQPELCPDAATETGAPAGYQSLANAAMFAQRVPRPRWLAVTVFESREEGTLQHRERIIDRCNIGSINGPRELRPEIPATITYYSGGQPQLLLVAESPREICAALDDCAVPAREDTP